MATRNYKGKQFNNQGIESVADALTVEEALQININQKPFTLSMRTPGEDANLIRGMLHSEDIISDRKYHPQIILKKENKDGIITQVDLTIAQDKLGSGYTNSRSLLSVSSCGICGKTELDELSFMGKTVDSKVQMDAQVFSDLFAKMNSKQFDFKQSGGTHAAAVFDTNGTLLSAMEDIGRHNAVDKAIGQLLLTNKLPEAQVITVSGRISYEIVIKVFKAGIPFLAAVSAPSSLAVDYAKELGISLLGFCREGRVTCYAHPYRINNNRSTKFGAKVS